MLFLLVLASAGVNAGGVANNPAHAKALASLLAPLANSAGVYSQRLIDAKGEELQASSGRFAVAEPGRFRWHTETPFEQLLVSDGETIWLFDPDLEQVTVKSFASQQEQLPVRILSGELGLIAEQFNVWLEQSDTEQRFTLSPNSTGNITLVELSFAQADLTSMVVTEVSGTRTLFEFSNREALPVDHDELFVFTPPVGADVFYDN